MDQHRHGGDPSDATHNNDDDDLALLLEKGGGPLRWLSLAVRSDECRPDAEILLRVPLESGRLYDGSAQFSLAIEYLKQQARGHLPRHRLKAQPPSPTSPLVPPFALTPVVLSGLIAALSRRHDQPQQQQREEEQRRTHQPQSLPRPRTSSSSFVATSTATVPLSSSELVLACNALRASALWRVRARRKVKRAVLCGTPLLLFLVYTGAGWLYTARRWSRHDVPTALVRLRYGSGAQDYVDAGGPYEAARRLAEAELWDRYGTGLLEVLEEEEAENDSPLSQQGGVDGLVGCAEQQRWSGKRRSCHCPSLATAPCAMHSALLSRPSLTRRDVQAGRRVDPPPPSVLCSSSCGGDNEPNDPHREPSPFHSLRLLGDTTVNRLVQKAIETHLRLKELSVLDVGCGVGGTLYGGLLTGSSDGGNTTKHTVVKGHSKFENSRTLRSYHGIAVSEAEIFHAQALADHYRRLGHLQQGPSIRFERRSFDDRLEERSRNGTVNTTDSDYSVMIAVESLTYSRDLRKTLLNLLPRLRTGGIMVVVDDVVLGSDDADRRIAVGILGRERPSLVTHSSWESFLRDAGCPLLEGYDLTFEHDLLVSPEDDDRSACEMNDPSRSSWFSVLASFVASKANTLWRTYGASSWWWGFASSSSAAAPGKAARMAQLHYDLARLRRVSIRRQEEYSVRGSLGYHLYVCRKV